jgi:hypothetical protein
VRRAVCDATEGPMVFKAVCAARLPMHWRLVLAAAPPAIPTVATDHGAGA